MTSKAGVDRSRLLFKVVQAWFNVQTGRVQSRFKLREHEDLGYLAGPRFPLDEAERPMAPASRDRMTASAGYRHGRRRRCGFSDCSGSCSLRRPQNRSDCWPPPNRNPRWRRTPCSEPATSFQAVPTPRNGGPQQPRRIHREACRARLQLHLPASPPPESSALPIDREVCRASPKTRKLMETNS